MSNLVKMVYTVYFIRDKVKIFKLLSIIHLNGNTYAEKLNKVLLKKENKAFTEKYGRIDRLI